MFGKKGYYLQANSPTLPVKYGYESLMFCSCFAACGPGGLVKMDRNKTSIKYKDILAHNLVASTGKL